MRSERFKLSWHAAEVAVTVTLTTKYALTSTYLNHDQIPLSATRTTARHGLAGAIIVADLTTKDGSFQ
jgi:hypothetical protein